MSEYEMLPFGDYHILRCAPAQHLTGEAIADALVAARSPWETLSLHGIPFQNMSNLAVAMPVPPNGLEKGVTRSG